MTVLDPLKPYTLFGIDAPIFLWIAAAGLVAFTCFWLLMLWIVIRRECRLHSQVRSNLESIRTRYPRKASEGLSAPAYDAIVRLFAKTPALRQPWDAYNALILLRRTPAGEDQFWATESADHAFSEAMVIDTRLNRRFFQAVPGIVTGVGLMFTFLAILVALIDVKFIEKTTKIEGIENLISGLSGKFVSSIAALVAATMYLLLDSRFLHRLSRSRVSLVANLDRLIPRLSQSKLLSDLHHVLAEQSGAFRQFNTDLSLKLRQGFSESIGPTISRMVEAIDQLNQFLVAAEAKKQDSITAEVRNLLQSMQHSIGEALEGMGSRFSESLSGTAMGEFTRVASSLGQTAKLLEDMNSNFQTTQSQLTDLVNFARSTTAEQMALGKSQVEDLTGVLRALMVQLNETAGTSVTTMTSALTNVVHDLSERVSHLSDQMTQSVRQSAETATGAVNRVLQDAGTWSARSAAQLAELIEKHQEHVSSIQDVRAELDRALSRFKDTLAQHASITGDLSKAAAAVSTFTTAAGGIASTMKDTQKSFQQVASMVGGHVEALGEANRQQAEMWRQVHAHMNEYKTTFALVGGEADRLLSEITKHIGSLGDVSQEYLGDLVKMSNDHFREATGRLGSSVGELKEYLDDLTDTLGKRRP